MKDQYFGDVNDYRKYGLLRSLVTDSDLSLLLAWMLTPDDGGSDGGKTDYLFQPERFAGFDPELFRGLGEFLARPEARRVSMIENSRLLRDAGYFPDLVPDRREGRARWFEELERRADGYDVVFLDPDNGLEVRSKPMGRKDSSKYAAWSETRRLWGSGKSLLIYQHFARERRSGFLARKAAELQDRIAPPLTEAFSTGGVVFLLAAQERHVEALRGGIERVRTAWPGQITVAGLSSS